MLRTPLVLVMLFLLQSCGLTDRFFTANECEGDTCEAPALLDNSNPEKKWFCYGEDPSKPWQCQNVADASKITSVQPQSSSNTQRSSFPTEPGAPLQSGLNTPTSQSTLGVNATQVEENRTSDRQKHKQMQDKILNSPANHYAVQLIALRELTAVQEYAGLNGIEDPLHVKIRNADEDWHILLLGVYESKESAEAAKQEWEVAKVLRVKPWIRQIGTIQSAMKEAQAGEG